MLGGRGRVLVNGLSCKISYLIRELCPLKPDCESNAISATLNTTKLQNLQITESEDIRISNDYFNRLWDCTEGGSSES